MGQTPWERNAPVAKLISDTAAIASENLPKMFLLAQKRQAQIRASYTVDKVKLSDYSDVRVRFDPLLNIRYKRQLQRAHENGIEERERTEPASNAS